MRVRDPSTGEVWMPFVSGDDERAKQSRNDAVGHVTAGYISD